MEDKPKLYFIPGLAATSYIYNGIGLNDYEKHFFDWTDPIAGDDISSYAKRLVAEIDQSQPFALIGSSLGGMMAVEMCKYCKPTQVFLISSIEKDTELPWYFKMFKWFPIYWLIPFFLMRWFVGFYRSISDRYKGVELNLVSKMLDQSTGKFFRWAIHQVVNLKQRNSHSNLIRIHGNKDTMFPEKFMERVDYQVDRGDHFMVIVRAKEIGEYIESRLKTWA